jgi:hypothetical protein
VTTIAAASGLLDRRYGSPTEPVPDVVRAAGSAAWLCQTALDHLLRTAWKYRTQAKALHVAPGPP